MAAPFDYDEKPRALRFAGSIQRGAQACAGIRRRHRTADMTHGVGVAVQRTEQRQIATCERAQAQAFSRGYARDHASASRANLREYFGSGTSLHAGASTSVSAASMRAVASLRSVVRSMRGAWIGNVAAR